MHEKIEPKEPLKNVADKVVDIVMNGYTAKEQVEILAEIHASLTCYHEKNLAEAECRFKQMQESAAYFKK